MNIRLNNIENNNKCKIQCSKLLRKLLSQSHINNNLIAAECPPCHLFRISAVIKFGTRHGMETVRMRHTTYDTTRLPGETDSVLPAHSAKLCMCMCILVQYLLYATYLCDVHCSLRSTRRIAIYSTRRHYNQCSGDFS
jgi:hypothetical protein